MVDEALLATSSHVERLRVVCALDVEALGQAASPGPLLADRPNVTGDAISVREKSRKVARINESLEAVDRRG